MTKKLLTVEAVLRRAQKFCAYQERCQVQVLRWLKGAGLPETDAGTVIDALLRDGFIDDVRFCEAYVRGKFHNNDWGRIKIKVNLQALDLERELIDRSMLCIPDTEYFDKLDTLIRNKEAAIGEDENRFRKRTKIMAYAYSKGYEPELIRAAMDRLLDKH